MTTSIVSPPIPDDTSLSESVRLWRIIGRLEATVEFLLQNQRELKEGQKKLRDELLANQALRRGRE